MLISQALVEEMNFISGDPYHDNYLIGKTVKRTW